MNSFKFLGIALVTAGLSVSAVSASHAADIVGTAQGDPNFSTLVDAVIAADLVGALSSPEGPYTVFAPTNDAFAKLPSSAVAKLFEAGNKDLLVKLLTYHVVPGTVLASEVVTLNSAPTLAGEDLRIKSNAAGVKVDNAKVTATDIVVDNGVIHVIDTVLMPKAFLGELNRR